MHISTAPGAFHRLMDPLISTFIYNLTGFVFTLTLLWMDAGRGRAALRGLLEDVELFPRGEPVNANYYVLATVPTIAFRLLAIVGIIANLINGNLLNIDEYFFDNR